MYCVRVHTTSNSAAKKNTIGATHKLSSVVKRMSKVEEVPATVYSKRSKSVVISRTRIVEIIEHDRVESD